MTDCAGLMVCDLLSTRTVVDVQNRFHNLGTK